MNRECYATGTPWEPVVGYSRAVRAGPFVFVSAAQEVTVMAEIATFGGCLECVAYVNRPAAYAVVAGEGGTVAAVKGGSGKFFLPGGRSLPGETAEGTVRREVREELARSVRLVRKIGEVTQFFYAADEDCHYKMLGVFFLAEFPDESSGRGEHDLFWLPSAEAQGAFFHESHAWAARQALASNAQEPRA